MTEYKLDIVLISEAHCTDKTNVLIKGFHIYTTNHPDGTSHAGSAIIIRSTIKHHLLPEYKTEQIQATTLAIQDRCGYFNVSAVYCPPKHRINSDLFSHFFKSLGNRFIAGGDWNSKHLHWGSRLITTRGRQLKLCVDINRLSTIAPLEPTNWPADHNRIPDILDFFITKGLSKQYMKIESCPDGSSDHTPVLLTISSTIIEVERPTMLWNRHTDWPSFREYIEENLKLNIRLKEPKEIDTAVVQLTNLIQVAAWRSTPTIKNRNELTNVPLEIKIMIQEKRRLRRVWQLSRHPQDKAALNRAITDLNKKAIRTANDLTLQAKLESLTATKASNYSLWKITRSCDKPNAPKAPIKKENGWARTSQDKADLFADHLTSVFKPNETLDNSTDEDIDLFLQQDLQMDLPPRPVSPVEVIKTIKRLDDRKAPGYDLITKEVLLELPRKAITFITTIFNATLRIGYFPSAWKVSEIIMIYKAGKLMTEKTSYRPISLLPTLSKMLEKTILRRIMPSLLERKVIPEHQFGFRERHGTVEQTHRVCDTIRKSLEQREYCSSAFLDIQQAFDKVWHKGLLCKIKQNISHSYFLILKSYLEDRIFYVKEGDTISEFRDINAGVPQGSVLGPMLYTLYTADLPLTPGITTATFADDTAILASNKDPRLASENLQKSLNKVNEWLQKWKIKASAAKSVQVTFTLKKGDCPPVMLGQSTLPHSDHVRYLGLHIDRKLTWRHHIDCKKQELLLKYNSLYWLLGRNSRLSLDNKLLIYKAILKPIWTYGLQLWGSASDSNINIIQRQQNKILRTIARVPWYITNNEVHEHLEIRTTKEEIRSLAAKYKERLAHHPNELARQLTIDHYAKRLKRHNILELKDRQ